LTRQIKDGKMLVYRRPQSIRIWANKSLLLRRGKTQIHKLADVLIPLVRLITGAFLWELISTSSKNSKKDKINNVKMSGRLNLVFFAL